MFQETPLQEFIKITSDVGGINFMLEKKYIFDISTFFLVFYAESIDIKKYSD